MPPALVSDHLAKKLYSTSGNGHDSQVLDLLQKGADPNSEWYNRVNSGYTPLMVACLDNHSLRAEYLLKWGARVDSRNVNNYTALHLACKFNNFDCVKELMAHNSSTDIKEHHGKTAVDLARENGNKRIVEFITNFKPQLKYPLSAYPSASQLSLLQVDRWYELGAHFRIAEDQLEEVKKSSHPTAAILIAAKVKNIDIKWYQIVEALIHIGMYMLVKIICEKQEGPNGWVEFIKYLVDSGGLHPTEPLRKNSSDTLLSMALAMGHKDVVDYLTKVKEPNTEAGSINPASDSSQSIDDKLSEIFKDLEHISAVTEASLVDANLQQNLFGCESNKDNQASLLHVATQDQDTNVGMNQGEEDTDDGDTSVPLLPRNMTVVTSNKIKEPCCQNKDVISTTPLGYPLHQSATHPNVTFYDEPDEKMFTSDGGHVDFNNGVKVTVPSHAVPTGSTMEIKAQLSFAPSNVFVMPEGIQSASPSYLVSSEGSASLNREVSITMEHFAKLSTTEEANDLVFLQADTLPRETASGHVYEYREVSDKRHEFPTEGNKGILFFRNLQRKFYKIGRKIKGKFEDSKLASSPNLYTLRIYRSPSQTTGDRLCIIVVSLFHPGFFKFLKKFEGEIIQSEYPSLSTDKADRTIKEPLTFAKLDAALKVACDSSWRRVVDQKTISKDSVDFPIIGNFKPDDLHSYPPRMVCQFFPEQGAISTTCTLTLHGFDKPVNVDIALLISKPQVIVDTNKPQEMTETLKSSISDPQVTVDTTKLQEATDTLKRTASKVNISQLGETVKKIVDVAKTLTSALGSSSLSDLASHTDLIKTEIKVVLKVLQKVAEECKRQAIKDSIGEKLPKMVLLSHQLCQVVKVKLRHCQDTPEKIAALDYLVGSGANLLNIVEHLLKDIELLDLDALIIPGTGTALAKVIRTIKEVCSTEWYSLAVELEISYITRKTIETNHSTAEAKLCAMLKHWWSRNSPPPSWSALIRALQSPVIGHGGIAEQIQNMLEVARERLNETVPTFPSHDLDLHGPLSVDKHLKIVRGAIWDARASWRDLGVELGINVGTLDAIQYNHHYDAGASLTDVLEHWLDCTTPPPNWTDINKALKSTTVGHGDIEAMLKKERL